MNIKLKFKIIELYGTQSRFAGKCGRNDNWISRIVTGRQLPTEQEKKVLCENLNIENIEPYLNCLPKAANH